MIESALQDYAARIDGALTARMADLTAAEVPERLSRAMAYSLLAGGKRIRGTLVLTAAELAGCPRKLAMPFAMAIEMVHAYSLIHDDLPAMDNDTLRRGKPTSHVVFGEAGAILAGDGLLNLAFEDMLAACAAQGAPAVAAAGCIAMAAGSAGMVGGQVLDIDATGHFAGEEALREMHAKKTGALLRAAIGAGLRLGSAPQGLVAAMERYGGHLGLLFQITDDILDCEGTAQSLGKSVGKDENGQKTTYVTLYGLEGARARAAEQTALALGALESLAGVDFFRDLAHYIQGRKK